MRISAFANTSKMFYIIKDKPMNKAFSLMWRILNKYFPKHHHAHNKIWSAFWNLANEVNNGL